MEDFGMSHWFSFKNACVYLSENLSQSALAGHASSMLFLHGRFGDGAVWRSLVGRLSRTYRCYCIDLPGFRHSFLTQDLPFSFLDYIQLINHLILNLTYRSEKLILVGHDFGGAVAQVCALSQALKVSSLILINSISPTTPLARWNTPFQGWFIFKKLLNLLKNTKTLEEGDQRLLRSPWEDQFARVSLTSTFRSIHSSWPKHYERQVWRKAMKELVRPVLLLWGKNDSLNPREVAVDLLNQLPDATSFTHEGCGHWPQLERSDWVFEKMSEFMVRNRLKESA